MNRTENLWNILRKEYGITSVRELNEALNRQKKVDITIFCREQKNTKEEKTAC